MKVTFYHGSEMLLTIRLDDFTTENRLWYQDMLADYYEISASEITFKIGR